MEFCRKKLSKQDIISEQGGIFLKIVKQAGHNKQAGWNILEYLISEQAEFYRKKAIFNALCSEETLVLTKICIM